MHMLALPIARRELLVLSRAAATWRNRLGTSGVVFVFGILFALMYHYLGQIGINQVMRLIGIGLSMMCLFTGVSLTADSIAEEKRAGTLGLLFLTNLSPFEILLGKLVAHAVLGFYTVLCALPLFSMSMIFGGMPFGDVLLYVLSALNVLFFSAAVGLFASSICQEGKRAASLGTLIVLFFWLGLPGMAVLLTYTGAARWLVDAVYQLSVNPLGVRLGWLLPPTSKWTNLVCPQVLAWAFIGLAIWCLPRRWQDEPPAKRWRLRDAWKAICYGSPATRLKLRRRLLDRNPFMWLASRDRLQTAGTWLISVSLIAFIVVRFLRGTLSPGFPIVVGIATAFVLQLAFSHAAAAQLLREYEQGTLELILSTPLFAHEVIDGQFAAARRQYRSLFATTFFLFWAGVLLLACQPGPRPRLAMTLLAVYSVLFLLQCHVLGWVGMWCVVKAPNPKKATSNAFFMLSIFPALMFGLIVASMQFLSWLAGRRFSPGPELLPLLFLLAFGNCIYWLRRAKRELLQELRLFAFRRYTPREPVTLFGQIGKFLGRCLHRARAPAKIFC